MSYLLDTNVISEIRRGRDRNVAAWAGEVTDPELSTCCATWTRRAAAVKLASSATATK